MSWQVFATVRRLTNLLDLQRGSTTLQYFVDEATAEVPKTVFGDEKTVALEGLCKNESGQVSRIGGKSCCQVESHFIPAHAFFVCFIPVYHHTHELKQ